jgi:hypothetical protein
MSDVVGARQRVYPGPDQLVLRGTILLGAIASVVAAQAAGARPNIWEQALLTVLAGVLALRPESSAGAVLLVGIAYVWSTTTDPLSPLVLVAAAGMLLVHLSAQVAAQGPAVMAVDSTQVRRHALRGLLLLGAGVVVWGLDQVADGLPDGRLVYAAGLTLMLVLTAVATRLVSQRR